MCACACACTIRRYALIVNAPKLQRVMEKGRVREERRSRSPQEKKEITKPMSTVEEVIREPQYVVDREKVSDCL